MSKIVNGETIIPFGNYKGKKLKSIPSGWWTTLYDSGKLEDPWLTYAFENVPMMQSQKRIIDKAMATGRVKVSFEYQGKIVDGELSKVSGGASGSFFHLDYNKFHLGNFFMTQQGEWRFTSNTDQYLEKYTDYFAKAVKILL